MASEKRDRFLRIAEKRTNKILKMIRLLSNCSNRGAYEYNESDVRKIFGILEEELRGARSKFTNKNKKDFSLR